MQTLQKQTSLFIEEKLTSLQGDSLANHLVRLEKEKAQKMTAISGVKCLEQFGRFNRVTLWQKMFAGLLIGTREWYSTRCKLTWKLRALKSCRFYFQLVPLTHHTEGTEFGLLPTPLAQEGAGMN